MKHLKVPDGARDHFNREAEEIFGEMGDVHIDSSTTQNFHPDSHVTLELNDENIIEIESMSNIDNSGAECDLFFETSEGPKGFSGARYQRFNRFINMICSRKFIRDILSENFISRTTTNWLKDRLVQGDGFYFTDYLESCARAAIKEYEIWVPIEDLSAASNFQFGGMTFQTISKKVLDDTFEQKVNNLRYIKNYDMKEIQFYFDQQHRCKQGLMAATSKFSAEHNKAKQKAMDKATLCTDILRSAWISNMFSTGLCPWAPRGKTFIEKEELYTVKSGIFCLDSHSVTANIFPGFLDHKKLSQFLNDLREHHLMLVEPSNKNFRQEIIDAIRVYSRSSKTRYLDEKLIFIFASIESLLLRNGDESISSFYDRFAFFVAKRPDERKQVSKLIRKIYGYRSKFVHHGSTLAEAEHREVDRFFTYVWYFFLKIPTIRHKFETKDGLLEYLDDMKYYSSKSLLE